ncbi:hypothetical protein Hanom_Chr04g00360781 [Helianthus anomalus]
MNLISMAWLPQVHMHYLYGRIILDSKSKVHGWSLWFTEILDLIPSFSKVHGWSLWFALCNEFSLQPTNLKVSTGPSEGPNALQSANHRDHPCTFGKSWGLMRYKVQTT